MKKLLLFTSLILGSWGASAQTSCATATAITTNGTFTAPAITGTYAANCYNDTETTDDGATPGPIYGTWFAYTPTANGLATFSSNLATNVAPLSNDTRVSVFTGTCSNLVCYAGNDDVSAANYKSSVTFPVAAGTTYYIQWDNFWNAAGFQFTVNLTPISCMPAYFVNDQTAATANTVTLSWDVAIGNPAGYTVEYGAPGFLEGTGTTVTTTTNSVVATGLTAGQNYEYYITSSCGAGMESERLGPVTFYASSITPYSNNFDLASDPTNGFIVGTGWGLSTSTTNAGLAQSGSNFLFSNVSATAAADAYVYLRPITLAVNEHITVAFKTAYLGDLPDVATFSLTVGNAQNAAAQTTTVQTFTNPGLAAGATTFTYADKTATWTAPAAGVYYFAIHNTSAATTGDPGTLLVDTLTTTSFLSVDQFLANKFTVFPNPANSVISLTNNENIIVNGITMADLNGRTVKQINYNNVSDIQINVSDLAAGMYMMTINSDKGSVTKKVIKN